MPRKELTAEQAPHSWDLEHWPQAVYPHTSGRARYLVRAHRDALMAAGALSRVGRDLIVIGNRYSRWLEQGASNVPGYEIAANGARTDLQPQDTAVPKLTRESAAQDATDSVEGTSKTTSAENQILCSKVSELGISSRTLNVLKSIHVIYVFQLVSMTEFELFRLSNIGVGSISNLEKLLQRHGLSFGMQVEPPRISANRSASASEMIA